MSGNAYTAAPLPPPGWLHDPATAQTRWWDGARWTDHVLPAQPTAGHGAVFGTDPRQRAVLTSRNGPAKASLILILTLLLGEFALVGLGMAAGSAGVSLWQVFGVLGAVSVISLLMWITAFALAIVGTVIAVRRPTRKREAVFALVFTSVVLALIVARAVVSIAVYGTV